MENGFEILAEIKAGVDAHEARKGRWKQNREMTTGETVNTPAYEGAYTGNFPLVPQKVDQLGAIVVDALLSVKPHCVARMHKYRELRPKLEKTIQFFADRSNIKNALKSVSSPAAWANLAWINTVWTDDLVFDYRVQEPDMTVVYPAQVERVADAKLFGVKKYIRAFQAKELYGKELTPITKDDDEHPAPTESKAVLAEDREVTIWDIYRQEKDGWFKYVLSGEGHILKRDEVKDFKQANCISEFFYKPRRAKDGYYSANSVVSDLAQLQLDANNLMGLVLDGTAMNVLGAFFTTGGQDSERLATQVTPGAIIQLETENLVPYQPKADLKYLIPALQMLMEQADRVARISEMAAGNKAPGVDTAKEASILAMGAQRSIDEYINNFSYGLIQLWKYQSLVLAKTWDDWFPVFGEDLGLTEKDRVMFDAKVVWEPSVASAGMTPESQMQMLLGLYQQALTNPNSTYDTAKIEQRMVENLSRAGVADAESLLKTGDPAQKIMELAQVIQAQGIQIDPGLLIKGVQSAVLATQEAIRSGVDAVESGTMLGNAARGLEGALPNPAGASSQSVA